MHLCLLNVISDYFIDGKLCHTSIAGIYGEKPKSRGYVNVSKTPIKKEEEKANFDDILYYI